jgi:hypothetical protein
MHAQKELCLLPLVLSLLATTVPSVFAQDTPALRCLVDHEEVKTPPSVAMAGKTGVMRCVRQFDNKRAQEYEFVEGRLLRQSEWDEQGRRHDLRYYENGALKTRARQVSFDGKPAWDREEYWDSGLLRLRGTYLEGSGAQGLIQTYDRAGPLANEIWYEQGRVIRRKVFDPGGQTVVDEELLPNGTVKSLMQRF